MDALEQKPVRLTVANTVTGDFLEVQFNPVEFTHTVQVNWARHTVPGLPHQRLHYVGTENAKFPMELKYDALVAGSSVDRLKDAAKFLESLCYPRQSSVVQSGGPPVTLLVCPNVASVKCVIGKLELKYTRFNLRMEPTEFSASIELEEVREVRLLHEEVRANGLQRATMDAPVVVAPDVVTTTMLTG